MCKHFQPHPSTTISGSNPCVIKFEIGKEGLPRELLPALGAGGPEFKSRRPDQSSLLLTGISQKPFPALWGKFGGPYWIIPSLFSTSCICNARAKPFGTFLVDVRN